jgi:hypothetical protein
MPGTCVGTNHTALTADKRDVDLYGILFREVGRNK